MKDNIGKTPLEDLRASALAHYEEASAAIHHWSSFVSDAIKAYNPESAPVPESGEWKELAQTLKEFESYFNYFVKTTIPKEGYEDAGNMWVQLTDKWNAFKKTLPSLPPPAPVKGMEDTLLTIYTQDELWNDVAARVQGFDNFKLYPFKMDELKQQYHLIKK